MKGHYVTRIKRSETNPEELLEKAVKLSLEGNIKKYGKEIECLLVEYYVNKNRLDGIDISEKPSKFAGHAINNEIALARRYFKNKELLLKSVEVLFHECEHVATWNYNNSIANDIAQKPIYFANINNAIYLTNPNEHKSRLAGIKYAKIYIEKMQEIINTEEKYQTEKNFKLLKDLKLKIIKKEKIINKKYQKSQRKKGSLKFQNSLKKGAEKCLNRLKKYKNKRHFHEKTIAKSKRYILDYLNSYNDKEFLQMVLSYCKDNEYLMIKDLLKTTSFEYDETDCDKLLFTYSNNYLKDLISGESLAKHSLLYYGKFPSNVEPWQKEGVSKVKENLKGYKFKGIPIKALVLKGNGMGYKLKLNGISKCYKDKNKLYLEVASHINSCDLDKMTFAEMEKINTLLGKEIISTTLQQTEDRKESKSMQNIILKIEEEKELQ